MMQNNMAIVFPGLTKISKSSSVAEKSASGDFQNIMNMVTAKDETDQDISASTGANLLTMFDAIKSKTPDLQGVVQMIPKEVASLLKDEIINIQQEDNAITEVGMDVLQYLSQASGITMQDLMKMMNIQQVQSTYTSEKVHDIDIVERQFEVLDNIQSVDVTLTPLTSPSAQLEGNEQPKHFQVNKDELNEKNVIAMVAEPEGDKVQLQLIMDGNEEPSDVKITKDIVKDRHHDSTSSQIIDPKLEYTNKEEIVYKRSKGVDADPKGAVVFAQDKDFVNIPSNIMAFKQSNNPIVEGKDEVEFKQSDNSIMKGKDEVAFKQSNDPIDKEIDQVVFKHIKDNVSDMKLDSLSVQAKTSNIFDKINKLIQVLKQNEPILSGQKKEIITRLQKTVDKLIVEYEQENVLNDLKLTDTARQIKQDLIQLQHSDEELLNNKTGLNDSQEGEITQQSNMALVLKVDAEGKAKQVEGTDANKKTAFNTMGEFITNSENNKNTNGNSEENSKDSQLLLNNKLKIADVINKKDDNSTEYVVQFENIIKNFEKNIPNERIERPLNMHEVPKENVLKQVMEEAKITLTDDRSEMIMQLKPENLGKLSLRIVTERGIMVAKFVAESIQVKQIIETNLPQLKSSLESQGINVQGFSVSVGDQNPQRDTNHRSNAQRFKRSFRSTGRDEISVSSEYFKEDRSDNTYRLSESRIDFTA